MKIRKSEIDRVNEINEEQWVLTLARKTCGVHQQHAFFILEGIIDEKATIWFMDLVGTPLLPNLSQAKIRIRNFYASSEEELSQSPLLYRCSIKEKGMYAEMMDLKAGDSIVRANNKSWLIDKKNALMLVKNIEGDCLDPPIFNIFGKSSKLTGSSAASSSKERGHNCFTYAKEKITELRMQAIKIEENKIAYYMDQFVALTSLTLRNNQHQPFYSNCCTLFAGGAVLIGTLAIVGLHVFSKTEQETDVNISSFQL